MVDVGCIGYGASMFLSPFLERKPASVVSDSSEFERRKGEVLRERPQLIWAVSGDVAVQERDKVGNGHAGINFWIKTDAQDQKLALSKRTSTKKWTVESLEQERRRGRSKEILQLLKQALHLLDRKSFVPDVETFATLLRSCTDALVLSEGRLIHEHIVRSEHERNRFLCNLLVEMYGKCGAVEEAQSVFDKLYRPNVFSWTIIIAAYVHNGYYKKALQLFQKMLSYHVKPNTYTFVAILGACLSLAALNMGIAIHANAVYYGFDSDVVIGTSLIHMYGKNGHVKDARKVFEKMHQYDLVSWNAMIAVYVQHGHGWDALLLFQRMQMYRLKADKITFVSVLGACFTLDFLERGKSIHYRVVYCGFASDIVIGNALIDMYAKCGSADNAQLVFDKMHCHDIVSWSTIIGAHAQHGDPQKALELYEKMQRTRLMPNEITFTNVLGACANLAALSCGQLIHDCLWKAGVGPDVVVGTALVNMYGKCRSLMDARWVFDHTPGQDVVLWNAMIAAYAQCGDSKEAVKLLLQMDQEIVKPDGITIVSVLKACSQTGLVQEGCLVFVLMKTMYNIIPTVEHYNCMVALLVSTGLFKEAEDLVETMPFQAIAVVWETLLCVCGIQADVE